MLVFRSSKLLKLSSGALSYLDVHFVSLVFHTRSVLSLFQKILRLKLNGRRATNVSLPRKHFPPIDRIMRTWRLKSSQVSILYMRVGLAQTGRVGSECVQRISTSSSHLLPNSSSLSVHYVFFSMRANQPPSTTN